MPNDPTLETTLLESTLKVYEAEYRDMVESWRLIETKAQGSIAVANIFIAAAFGFARDITIATNWQTRLALDSALSLLVVAIGLGLGALFVRRVRSPLAGRQILQMVDDFLRVVTPQDRTIRYANLLRDQIGAWDSSLETFRRANRFKGYCVAAAQVVLLAVGALVAGMVMWEVDHR